MNNRQMLMCPVCSVRMFMCGMKVESWQKKRGREEKYKNSYAPGC